MAKTWFNYPCRFSTSNTENQLGNSAYQVTLTGMTRFAPVNTNRAPNQLNTGNPNICYVAMDSELYTRIMRIPSDRDDLITIKNVILDSIIVNADAFNGLAFRKPQIGFCPFDFVNDNGTLSLVHVGHQICRFLS